MKSRRLVFTVFGISLISLIDASGYDGLDLYDCVISAKDRVNSEGQRLNLVREILAQDRANFHKFRRQDTLDSSDGYFTTSKKRATWKTVQLRISPILANRIKLGGDVEIKVFVLTPDLIDVRPGLLTPGIP